jgi:CheY-like chemotaxis protein
MDQGPNPLAGKRLLVVEDEWLVSLMVQETAQALGCEIAATAARLEDAIRLSRVAEFDILVLDLNLGGEHSFEVARIARERGKPVLFASGYSAPILPPDFAGAHLLQKPFRGEDFQSALLAAAG